MSTEQLANTEGRPCDDCLCCHCPTTSAKAEIDRLKELLQKVVDRGQLPIGMGLRDMIRVAIGDRSPGSPLAPLHPEKD